jgi:hypothetical protein
MPKAESGSQTRSQAASAIIGLRYTRPGSQCQVTIMAREVDSFDEGPNYPAAVLGQPDGLSQFLSRDFSHHAYRLNGHAID